MAQAPPPDYGASSTLTEPTAGNYTASMYTFNYTFDVPFPPYTMTVPVKYLSKEFTATCTNDFYARNQPIGQTVHFVGSVELGTAPLSGVGVRVGNRTFDIPASVDVVSRTATLSLALSGTTRVGVERTRLFQ